VAARLARLIAIVGPTASGKSTLALRLAEERGGEVVSCDSLQVYRGLDIGSAKASPEERRRVPHHLLDVVSPDQPFSAAEYARLARAALAEMAARGRLPLVAGGSFLYLRALLEGLFAGPARADPLRARLQALADRFGDRRLHRLLSHVDAEAARRIAPRDRVRIVRALEVYWLTGRPMSGEQRKGAAPLEGFERLVIGLRPDRQSLRTAVVARTRSMLAAGLVGEVRDLLARGYAPQLRPLQAIGYRQALAVVAGHLSEEQAERAIVVATMRFAKRQMTWLRHQQPGVRWYADVDAAHAAAVAWLDAEETASGVGLARSHG
jgi:tRNA dimethylallyltransferase